MTATKCLDTKTLQGRSDTPVLDISGLHVADDSDLSSICSESAAFAGHVDFARNWGAGPHAKTPQYSEGTASCVECQSVIHGGYDPEAHDTGCSEYDDRVPAADDAYWAASPSFWGG